jgi:peptidyl-prolyl cis-trans isomerase B (cyclophilin B)
VLDQLQNDLEAQGIQDVQIIAVSMPQFASADKTNFVAGRDVPLVQDTQAVDATAAWNILWRDLVILDKQSRYVGRVNLTTFDPDPAVNGGENYNLLKSMLLGARNQTEPSVTGNLVFQLFDDLAPRTTARVTELVNQSFYNGLSFHSVINDLMIQGGDPNANGSGGSGIRIDDEFDSRLTFTGYAQLGMASSGDDTNDSQLFVTDLDLDLAPYTGVTVKAPPQELNLDRTIFGQLIEGYDLLQQIMLGMVTTANRPVSPVVINDGTVFDDVENAVVRLSAPAGFSGSSTITVTATNTQGLQIQRSFLVNVLADTINDRPFLGALTNLGTTQSVPGTPVRFTVPATDLENDALTIVVRDPNNFANQPANVTVSVDQGTREVTLTPASNFAGAINLLVGVRDGTRRVDTNGDQQITAADDINAQGNFDTQRITLTVRAAGSNGIPAITAPLSAATTVDQPFEFVVAGADPDADQVIFAATALAPIAQLQQLNLRADEHVEGGVAAQVTLIEYLDFQ